MDIHPTEGYTRLQIALHWIIAALVILQLVFGESIGEVIRAGERGTVPSTFDQVFASVHYWVGISILALVALRLWLRRLLGAPPAPQEGWMQTAAKLSHLAFYVVLVLMPVTGLLAFYIGDPYGDIHELGKPLLIALIALHAFAALYHQFWLKDGTLRRILVPRD